MARNQHDIHGYKMIIYSLKLKVKIRPIVLWENAEGGLQSQEPSLFLNTNLSNL